MAVNKALLKEQLQFFSKAELVEMLVKLSVKGHNFDFLLVNFLDKTGGELQLFDDTLEEIIKIRSKEFKGRTKQHQRLKMLSASIKSINGFIIEAKTKKLEADLVLNVLEYEFIHAEKLFGARFSGYDYKVALLLKRLINIVQVKMHPDYLVDFQDKINSMLEKLHSTSNRIKTVSDLPLQID